MSAPENGKVRCEPSTHACPSGFYCAIELNTCWRNGTDASLPTFDASPDSEPAVSPDASPSGTDGVIAPNPGRDGMDDEPLGTNGSLDAAGGGAVGTGGATGNGPTAGATGTGGMAGSTDGGAPDASISGTGSGADGVNCAVPSDCQSGSCVDGVCCESACSDACTACKFVLTGRADGRCAAVALGKRDPRGICVDETSKNECGKDGTCDGAGACHYVETTLVCAHSSCTAAGFIPQTTCDGKGTCKPRSAIPCGLAACDSITGCLTECRSERDCAAGSYCNAATKKCALKKVIGVGCGADEECASGPCVDGVCCKTGCSGSCYACNVPGLGGTCSPVPAGTVDPKNVCAVSSTTCGTNGKCNGSGGCYVAPARTECGSSCSGNVIIRKSCDGAGNCTGTGVPCNNNLTCANSTDCKTNCSTDTDCTGGLVCNYQGQCAPLCLFDTAGSAFDDACVAAP